MDISIEGLLDMPVLRVLGSEMNDYTKAFAEFLLLEMIDSTPQDVARKHGISYDILRGLLDRYVNAKVETHPWHGQ